MTQVLERLGYQVHFPEAQTCCGQPAFNTGYTEEARKIMTEWRDWRGPAGEKPIICVPSMQ